MKLLHGLTSSLAPHHLVDRHFAGENGAWSERRMWRHFRRCGDCRTRYRTRSMLEALEPGGGEEARQRLGRVLFKEPRRALAMVAVPLTFGAALAAWTLVPRGVGEKARASLGAEVESPGFQSRGGTTEPVARGPAFAIVRVPDANKVRAMASPVRAGSIVHGDEPLAFTYQNPLSPPFEYLMIFAVDDAGKVFWYWPAWTEVESTPTSIPISLTTGPRELAQAVRQPLARGGLTMMALFSMHPHNVREVEAAVARPRPLNGEPLHDLPGIEGTLVAQRLEVVP